MQQQPLNPNNFDYDYAFVGLGASNGLILLKLLEKKLLDNKRVVVFEPSYKNQDDKTYCFWAKADEEIVESLKDIIWRKYVNVITNSGKKEDISNQPYFLIRSIDFYELFKKQLLDAEILIKHEGIKDLLEANHNCCIQTNERDYYVKHVFDSRPSLVSLTNQSKILINQSFYGFKIRCKESKFDVNTFNMMDFSIEQKNYTQFLYVLPYSDSEALVEITRFGETKIDQEYATEILNHEIQKRYGSFEIIGNEVGCIPMTNHRFKSSPIKGHTLTGTSANLVKPSTGYGFKNMFYFAGKLVSLIEQRKNLNEKVILHDSKFRFWFYDTLLLYILVKWPTKGAVIFRRLFQKNNIKDIFNFLDENTNLYQEIRIFISLPIAVFLKSLFYYLYVNHVLSKIGYLMVFIAVMVIMLYDADLATKIGYMMIGLGFVFIGLPHGALDYYNIKPNNRFSFVMLYILVVIVYFILWILKPEWSLILFLFYSAFHFGESELHDVKIKSKPIYFIRATFIGGAILLFILSTHLNESIQVISDLANQNFANKLEPILTLNGGNVHYYALVYLFIEYIITKKINFIVLLFLLILGSYANLLVSFMAYFICQHSLNSWIFIKQTLNKSSYTLYKEALPFTLSALLFLLSVLIYQNEIFEASKLNQSYFYIFLACVSLPHVFLMSIFIKRTYRTQH